MNHRTRRTTAQLQFAGGSWRARRATLFGSWRARHATLFGSWRTRCATLFGSWRARHVVLRDERATYRMAANQQLRSPSTHTPMKYLLTLISLISVLVATGGCSRSVARMESNREVTPAAVFKPGRGIQLSTLASEAIQMKSADVASRDVADAKAVAAIPAGALLRTIKGDFVYVANGGWFLRTPVTVGAFDGSWYEVKEGLYEGDTLVTHGARAIWLAELQAVNGGVGCADDN